ncbi:MAG: NUDIX hydrolase [Myxococcota bacterium]
MSKLEDGEKLGTRREFAGKMLKLDVDTVRLPNGVTLDLEVVRHPGAAAVLPLTADGDVIFVYQYRYTVGGAWLMEIPAGKLDSDDEDPRVCAERELLEETGFRAGRITPLGSIFVSPGFTDERISLYLAQELTAGIQELEADEVLEVRRLPWAEALEKATNGEITDAKSAVAILRAARVLAKD